MVLTLGLDTMFGYVEAITTAIVDEVNLSLPNQIIDCFILFQYGTPL